MAMPFLEAMKTESVVPDNCNEREFVVSYSRMGCNCSNCIKKRSIRAISCVDAINRFIAKFPVFCAFKAEPA